MSIRKSGRRYLLAMRPSIRAYAIERLDSSHYPLLPGVPRVIAA